MNINGKWYSEPELQAYVNKLLARIDELEDKHFSECRQIAHYADENKRMKEQIEKLIKEYEKC